MNFKLKRLDADNCYSLEAPNGYHALIRKHTGQSWGVAYRDELGNPILGQVAGEEEHHSSFAEAKGKAKIRMGDKAPERAIDTRITLAEIKTMFGAAYPPAAAYAMIGSWSHLPLDQIRANLQKEADAYHRMSI